MRQDLGELKQTERLFIAVRWAAVPAIAVLGWLHDPLTPPATVALAGGLALMNAVIWRLNRGITSLRVQQVLGAAALGLDTLAATVAISFFIADRSTTAYAGFALVVIQASIRYALAGGLAMAGVSAVGLAVAMWARLVLHDVPVSIPGYAFWLLFIVLLALALGLLVRQSRERQLHVRRLSGERARLQERHRLSRELHDTLLKTLHGLSLEAHSLRAPQPAEVVEEKARYIEEVCAKAAVDIRELIFDLRQDVESPLRGVLEEMVTSWSARTGVPAQVRWEGDDPVLPQRLHYDLRQALEEALLNVERHAHATDVAVAVEVSERALELTVRNNGRGESAIAANGAGGGLGLISMKERAEQWRGELEFRRDEKGATLRIRIPWPPTPAVEEGVRG